MGGKMSGARNYEALDAERAARGVPLPKRGSLGPTRHPQWHSRFLFILFLLTLPLVNPWVRGDGIGYYSYLRAGLIDHNLDFKSGLSGREDLSSWRGLMAQGHLLPEVYTKTGHLENHFSVGPAILWSPALVTIHLAVVLLDRFGANIPADGYSRLMCLPWVLRPPFTAFRALFLAFRMARKYFEPDWAFLATIGIWLGQLFAIYMYFNPACRTHFPHFRFPSFFGIGDAPSCSGRPRNGGFGSVRRPDGKCLLSECYFVDLPRPRNDLPGSYGGSAAADRASLPIVKLGVVFNTVWRGVSANAAAYFRHPPDYLWKPL